MANRIEGYDERIISCAQKEFLEKGYNEASLRNIAKAAGVSTSTMYTRFGDKEGMFAYLISPTEKLPVYLEKALGEYFAKNVEEQRGQYEAERNKGFDAIIDMIYEDYLAYKLLISCAPGDTYKNYLEKITEIDVRYTVLFLDENNSRVFRENRINREFCHVVSTAFYSALFHCVEHDMSREDAAKYINELREFYQRGWAGYFNS
ncbi:MAG: TetR/AcrR family transcriptional regulator [Lachnospiraceae bacterium]|nr:TetR/AcrR family transcriptional regulator [Lachnospiraceae bacterium]